MIHFSHHHLTAMYVIFKWVVTNFYLKIEKFWALFQVFTVYQEEKETKTNTYNKNKNWSRKKIIKNINLEGLFLLILSTYQLYHFLTLIQTSYEMENNKFNNVKQKKICI